MPEQPLQNSLFKDDDLFRQLGWAILAEDAQSPDSAVNRWLTTATVQPRAEST